MNGFFAAAQNGGVAGFETKAGGVSGDVGTRFVDDDHDANGRGNFLQAQAVGTSAFVEDSSNRIGQRRDFAQTFGHAGDAFVIEFQTVEHGAGKAGFGAGFHVAGVGLLDGGAVLFEASAMASRQAFFSAVVSLAN